MLDFGAEETIDLDGGALRYWPLWLGAGEADRLMAELRETVNWQQSHIRIAGRRIPVPRLNAWYGDAGADYSYSGVALATQPWLPVLRRLKARVEESTGERFNSALLNLYRDGRDSVDWHSDDEPELGRRPQVASVSLGCSRRFELRHRQRRAGPCKLVLSHGSLLLMSGAIQHNWQHRVPKERGVQGERINITFRRVEPRPNNKTDNSGGQKP